MDRDTSRSFVKPDSELLGREIELRQTSSIRDGVRQISNAGLSCSGGQSVRDSGWVAVMVKGGESSVAGNLSSSFKLIRFSGDRWRECTPNLF